MSTANDRRIPILNTLHRLAVTKNAAFYAPGHKKGRAIPGNLSDLLGNKVFRADLPELPELDNLFAPEGVIKEAQTLAAKTFSADQTWFLVNGSTCGIVAAILATCHAGEKIILPRNIHRSAIAGLIVSGAIPIFIDPEYDRATRLAYNINPEAVAKTLQKHPDAKAVMVLHPTYQGVCSDLGEIADVTHAHNIPLLVDEAHGAHFAFHPQLPPAALSLGADLSVQSTHKVLSAMTQASMLHLQGTKICPQKISKALQLLQSTSPSYLLLASLDAAREQMALEGEILITKTLNLAATARSKLSQIAGLSVLEAQIQPGFASLDLTRLTIDISQLGMTGYEADEILHQQLGVTCELPLMEHLTFILSIGNNLEDIDKLIEAFVKLTQGRRLVTKKSSLKFQPLKYSQHNLVMSPREAYFATTETVSLTDAINRISAELVCPYPPGIPVLMPGEIITLGSIDYLQEVLAAGGTITGCSDNSLQTLEVIN
jgi:arginine/lysine/ornithine decarboxylase